MYDPDRDQAAVGGTVGTVVWVAAVAQLQMGLQVVVFVRRESIARLTRPHFCPTALDSNQISFEEFNANASSFHCIISFQNVYGRVENSI